MNTKILGEGNEISEELSIYKFNNVAKEMQGEGRLEKLE
jgi:hypothetical protein